MKIKNLLRLKYIQENILFQVILFQLFIQIMCIGLNCTCLK